MSIETYLVNVVIRASVEGKVVGGGPKDGQLLCNNSPVSLHISVIMAFIVHRQIIKLVPVQLLFSSHQCWKAPTISRDHTVYLERVALAYTCTSRMHGIVVLFALSINPLDQSLRK
jgi:hypothetical protein